MIGRRCSRPVKYYTLTYSSHVVKFTILYRWMYEHIYPLPSVAMSLRWHTVCLWGSNTMTGWKNSIVVCKCGSHLSCCTTPQVQSGASSYAETIHVIFVCLLYNKKVPHTALSKKIQTPHPQSCGLSPDSQKTRLSKNRHTVSD